GVVAADPAHAGADQFVEGQGRAAAEGRAAAAAALGDQVLDQHELDVVADDHAALRVGAGRVGVGEALDILAAGGGAGAVKAEAVALAGGAGAGRDLARVLAQTAEADLAGLVELALLVVGDVVAVLGEGQAGGLGGGDRHQVAEAGQDPAVVVDR